MSELRDVSRILAAHRIEYIHQAAHGRTHMPISRVIEMIDIVLYATGFGTADLNPETEINRHGDVVETTPRPSLMETLGAAIEAARADRALRDAHKLEAAWGDGVEGVDYVFGWGD